MTTANFEHPSLMNGAIRVIIAEHGGIWRVLDILEQLQRQMNLQDQAPDAELISSILDYLAIFSRRIHQSGHDILLHRLLRERMPEAEALLSRQTEDHVIGAVRIAELRGLLSKCAQAYPNGRDQFSKQLSRFIFALRKHIKREEGIVVPLAREHLLEQDWEALVNSRDQQDDPLFGPEVREEFRLLRNRILELTPAALTGGATERAEPLQQSGAGKNLLELRGLNCFYGSLQALKGLTLAIQPGEVVALIGTEGSGKTTLLRAISGLESLSGGEIRFLDLDITRMPADKRVFNGLVHVPEGRQVFGPMSVEDNILLGSYSRKMDASVYSDMERLYEIFPSLARLRRQTAGTLSAGYQQMLAIARALMAKPKLLMLDEPSRDLPPEHAEEIYRVLVKLKNEGISIFLAERHSDRTLEIADRCYLLEGGTAVISGPGHLIREDLYQVG